MNSGNETRDGSAPILVTSGIPANRIAETVAIAIASWDTRDVCTAPPPKRRAAYHAPGARMQPHARAVNVKAMEPVLLERRGAVAVITLSRPQARNALDVAALEALEAR